MKQLHPPVRSNSSVNGLLLIHSAPKALCQHIEWGLQSILGNWVNLKWSEQPHFPGTFRTSVEFRDRRCTASTIASALRAWHYIRFEVREDGDGGGEYFRYLPEHGIHRVALDALGNVILDENVISKALAESFDEESLRLALEKYLGNPWEVELEPLRNIELEEVKRLKAI